MRLTLRPTSEVHFTYGGYCVLYNDKRNRNWFRISSQTPTRPSNVMSKAHQNMLFFELQLCFSAHQIMLFMLSSLPNYAFSAFMIYGLF